MNQEKKELCNALSSQPSVVQIKNFMKYMPQETYESDTLRVWVMLNELEFTTSTVKAIITSRKYLSQSEWITLVLSYLTCSTMFVLPVVKNYEKTKDLSGCISGQENSALNTIAQLSQRVKYRMRVQESYSQQRIC